MNDYRYLRNETAPITSGIRRSTVHSYGTTTSSLLESARTSGSRCDPTFANSIKHILQPGETLQGIALRYGCSTHDIRRANRLLITDNIHLRESLLIPIPISPESDSNTNAAERTVDNGSDNAAHERESNSVCQVDYVDECAEGSTNKTFTKPAAKANTQLQAICTVPKSRSEYALPSNNGVTSTQSTAIVARQDVQSSATPAVPNVATGAACTGTGSKQFFDKYDQFLADIKPNVTRMEEETERIAKQYTADSSTLQPNSADVPSSTLLYRAANEVGRNTRASGMAPQRSRTSQNGVQQNGSSSIFSRWFTFGSSQTSTARSNSNYVVRGYQSELERAEPTSISHRDEDNDFYSI